MARPDLISMLNSRPRRRLILICAPAGYGKSTLTAQWLAQLEMPGIWVSLDDSDDDLRSFILRVVTALRANGLEFGGATEKLLSGLGLPSPDTIVRQLSADLAAIGQECVLVLDDFESVSSPEIRQVMNLLLEHAPASMQIVLISRTDPPLRLARFRANGDLLEIREQHLAFSLAESMQFYNERFELELTLEVVQRLHESTEGWVAGLQLIGVAYHAAPQSRDREPFELQQKNARIADEYLWDEIFQRQPDDIRAFLLRTSILDRFIAGLCNAVTGQSNSEEMIRRCERDNLFVIPLDGVGGWYRYHQLFADFLRNQLARSFTDEERSNLHLRASVWFESAGFIKDAVRHALAGQCWDRAAALLEQQCAPLFAWDRLASLREWLHGLPAPVFERSPQLAFWLAWALARMARWTDAAQPFQIAEEAWLKADDPAGRGSLLLWKACFGFDRRKSIAHAELAQALLPEERAAERLFSISVQAISQLHLGEPERAEPLFAEQRSLAASSGLTWFHLQEMSHSAGALIQRGKLHDAAVLCEQVIQAAGDPPSQLWVHAAFCRLGTIHYEWDQLPDASRHLLRANALTEMTGSLQWGGRIQIGLAKVAWACRRREDALDHLDRGLAYAKQIGNSVEERTINAWQARFRLDSLKLDLVRQWAGGYGWDVSRSPEYGQQVEYLTYVRFLIRDRRPELALSVLTAFGELAEATGRHGDLIEISILAALAHSAAGDAASAQRSLRCALQLGTPNDAVRVFIDEGEDLAPLLRREALRNDHRAFAQRLLAGIEGAGSSASNVLSGQSLELSEREIEVLRLAGTGMPNREIGTRLFISEATVKRHMNHILRKLEAANRIQAIQRARERGLL
jgi:LuxR family maltose regulon positive regulatory protein